MIIFELVSSRAVEFIKFIVLFVFTFITSFVEDFYVIIFLLLH